MSRAIALLLGRVSSDAVTAALADTARWPVGTPSAVLSVDDEAPPSPAVPLPTVAHVDLADTVTSWLTRAALTTAADGTRLCDLTCEVAADGRDPLPFHLWWSVDSYLQPRVAEALRLARRLRAALEAEAPQTVYRVVPRGGDPRAVDVATDVLQRWQAAGRGLRVETVELPQASADVDAGPFDPTTTPRGMATFERRLGRGCETALHEGVLRLTSASDLGLFQAHVAAGTSTLEVVLQRVAGNPGVVGFELDDGTQRQSVRVDADALRLETGERVALETGRVAVYRLHLEDGQARLEVDGRCVLVGPTLRGSQPECLWGHLRGDGHAVSDWHRVRWGRLPAAAAGASPTAPRREVPAPSPDASSTLPRPRSHALVGWSGSPRLFEPAAGASTLAEVEAALQTGGLSCTRLSVEAPQHGEPFVLSSWLADLPVSRPRIEHELRAAWARWRQAAPPLPEADDVALDGLVARRVEQVMPKVAGHVCEAWAFDEYCRRFHPASLVSDRVLGCDRHLAAVAARHGVPTLALLDGPPPHSLYGLRLPATTHPKVDRVLVCGEAQREEALRGGELPCPVDPTFDARIVEHAAEAAGTSQAPGARGPLRLALTGPFLAMEADAPASRQLALLTDESSYVKHVLEPMGAFRARFPDALVVTFDHHTRDQVTAHGAVYWRDLLLPAQHYDLVGRSNARLDRLIERLGPTSREFILPYYHECASILVSAVFATELAQQNEALYMVWPALNADLQAFACLDMQITAFGSGERTRALSFGQVEVDWQRTSAQLRTSSQARRALDASIGKELGQDDEMLVWTSGRRPEVEDPAARVLIALDASGSSSNIGAARGVVEELTRRGAEVVLLGPTDAVVRQCRTFCPTSWRPPHAIDSDMTERSLRIAGAVAAELAGALRDHPPGSAEWILFHTIVYRLPSYVSGKLVAEATLDDMHRAYPFDAVMTYADANLISHWTGTWARARGLTWNACLQILISKHPDTSYFPADVHLVYGEQCAEVVRGSGAQSEIACVGSTLFDAGVGRALEDDLDIVHRLVPAWGDRKLVVVGTEHRPNEEVEVAPILRQLSAMPDVHVVLKLHPDDSEPFFRGLVDEVPHRDNITLLTRCDLFALLHAADLLICMRSNIIVNAAMLGTPTLICDFSTESPEENWSNFTIDFEKEGLGVGCYRADDVSEAVRRQLFDDDVRRATRERLQTHLRRFNGAADGRTAQRIADYLLERR